MGAGCGCGCKSTNPKSNMEEYGSGSVFQFDAELNRPKKKKRKTTRKKLSVRDDLAPKVVAKLDESNPRKEEISDVVILIANSEQSLIKALNHTPAENKKIIEEQKYVGLQDVEEKFFNPNTNLEPSRKGSIRVEEVQNRDEDLNPSSFEHSKDPMWNEENFEGSVLEYSGIPKREASDDQVSRDHPIENENVEQNMAPQGLELVFSTSEELRKMPILGETDEGDASSEQEKVLSQTSDNCSEEEHGKLKLGNEESDTVVLVRSLSEPQRTILPDIPMRMSTLRGSGSKSPFITDRELRVKKRTLVDAYMEAIPSSRRQLTMMGIAVDKIWSDVTEVKGQKLTLDKVKYRKELAWLKSRLADPIAMISPRKSLHLKKALDSTRDSLHDRIGVGRRDSILGKSLLEAKSSLHERSGVSSPIKSSRTPPTLLETTVSSPSVYKFDSKSDKGQPSFGSSSQATSPSLASVSGNKL